MCLVLFTASCSNAEPTDPALVGSWETTAVLDGRQWKFTYEITPSHEYTFASVTHDGKVSAHNGQWSVTSPRGFDDAGTYKFSGADSVSLTGKYGTNIWTRVAGGNKPTNTKVDHLLIGTWRTEMSIDGRQWSFTWVIKGIGNYQLTGITKDGTLTASNGHWKIETSSGQTEEGNYAFLNNGTAMSMTGPKGTGMWSRAGKTAYEETVAKLNKFEKKPKPQRQPKAIIPLCTASMDEKGAAGVDTEAIGEILKTLDFTTRSLPEGFHAPSDQPNVTTWRAPQKQLYNLCGRGVFSLRGPKMRAKIYYYVHNTEDDAAKRAKDVQTKGWDTSFVMDHLGGEKMEMYVNQGPNDGPRNACVDRKAQRVSTPHRVLCVDENQLSGVVIMVRGDFEQYNIDKVTAVHEMAKLTWSARKVLTKALK